MTSCTGSPDLHGERREKFEPSSDQTALAIFETARVWFNHALKLGADRPRDSRALPSVGVVPLSTDSRSTLPSWRSQLVEPVVSAARLEVVAAGGSDHHRPRCRFVPGRVRRLPSPATQITARRGGSEAVRRGIGLASTLERVRLVRDVRAKGVAMAQENVVVVRFTEPSKAYQALSVLKDSDASGRIGLESAAVVERTAAGELPNSESADNVGLVGTASGSLIGMLVGVLGGPVGVLLGWGAGAMMGGAFDVDRAVTSDEALTVLGQAIPTDPRP